MTKIDFLKRLEDELCGLPKEEIAERIGFYSEMIDDYIEDGLSEEEAVKAVGSPEKIAEQILTDTPLTKLVKEKIKPKKKIGTLTIILIVLGSPIWLSIGLSLFAVALSLYISLWAVVVSLWVTFAAVLSCGFGGILAGALLIYAKSGLTGLFLIGCGLACLGVAILLYFLCELATKGTVVLLKMPILALKRRIAKRGECND